MRLFQWWFFIVILVFSRKCGWFIRSRHWFGCFLPCTWIRWVIRRCFQLVVWGRWGQGIGRNFNIIMCRTDMFLFPHCILMMQCIFQFFLSLVYHEHHIISLWMLISVRVKSTSQVKIGFFISSSVEDSFKPKTC